MVKGKGGLWSCTEKGVVDGEGDHLGGMSCSLGGGWDTD